jgi:hypothetical protein
MNKKQITGLFLQKFLIYNNMKSQDYWDFELCPSSNILNNRMLRELDSFPSTPLVPLENS